MNKKEEYRKAAAALILFDNSDVVVTSDGENGGCKNTGHDIVDEKCHNDVHMGH